MNCDWVWGAFMFFPKSIIPQLPKKNYRTIFLCTAKTFCGAWDFKQLGYEIHFLPEAKVMHVHKGSVSKDKWMWITKTTIKNHAQLMKKYYPDFRWAIFALIYKTKQYGFLLWKKIVS